MRVKPEVAAAPPDASGAAAERFVSQTSSGSTSETWRRRRSQATRPDSAAESAPIRAPFSAASVSSRDVSTTGTTGIAAIWARSPSSSACLLLAAPPALITIDASAAVASAAPPTPPKTTPRFASKLRLTSSRGSRLTARMPSPRSRARSRRPASRPARARATLLRHPHPVERIDHADRDADQPCELRAEPRQVGGAARERRSRRCPGIRAGSGRTGARRRAPARTSAAAAAPPPARPRAAPR